MDTLGEVLHASTRRSSTRVAITRGDRSLTYGLLAERGGRLASALRSRGLRPGDRVAAFLDDELESIESFVGCALGGFTLVPVNARFRAGEATHVVHDSGASALLYSTSLGDAAADIDGLDELRAVVAIGRGDRVPAAIGYDDALGAAARLSAPAAVAPEDIAVIGYTSGTTGFPKGAKCSHRAVVTCTRLVPQVQGMLTNGRAIFVGSFSFVSALWGILFPHLWTGATLHLADPADVDAWVAGMARHAATYTWVPSPLVRAFSGALSRQPAALRALRTVVHTGSKVPHEFLAALIEVIGDRLIETWGLTETVGPLTATTPSDLSAACRADNLLASVGRPVPTAEIALLAPDGSVNDEPGTSGELLARADTLFSGYLGRSNDDPDTFVDGWFRTGDVGRIDGGGYVYIEDRFKDVIVSGGMNVYPAEVELAIQTLPGVVECAVFGVPDVRWGETVAAAVVAAAGTSLDATAVIEHVRSRLASYKKPTVVHFVPALPRNASMKVQKHLLRELV